MAIEIVDLPIKNGGSFHSYVSLPEGIDHEKIINSSNIGWMSTGILTIFSAPGDHSDKKCHGQNLGKLPSY
jgi:hypothetical protein